MPTGYTSGIGKGQTFEAFVLDCARAFGALVGMRDSPGEPIPEEIKPSQYEKKALDEAQSEYDRTTQMTEEEANKEARDIFLKETGRHQDRVHEKKDLRVKYEAMLRNVAAWMPPSRDHEGLKKMMREQVMESIDYDCSLTYIKLPVEQTGKEWHQKQLTELSEKVDRRRKSWADEVERAASRTEWIQQLRASLGK